MTVSVLLVAATAVASAEGPVAALQEARDLLLARDFQALASVVEAKHASTREPTAPDELGWTLNAFRFDDPTTQGLISDWVAAQPNAWPALLARAVNRATQAERARGTEWAAETSEAQFRRMRERYEEMRADCAKVHALDRRNCGCHRELVRAARTAAGTADALAAQAFRDCPRDFGLYAARVQALTPRWGGSYDAMRSTAQAARRAGLAAPQVRELEAYITYDRASLAKLAKDFEEADRLLDDAIQKAPAALLYVDRAAANRRRRYAREAVRDAESALAASGGGWSLPVRHFKRLLITRAWALNTLGHKAEAVRDIGLAAAVAPPDDEVKGWQRFLAAPKKTVTPPLN